ncbi:TLR2 agonist LprA [Tsukamurella soli]|uniref:TLR2 agonist LprA n=1 Tax=Tsukamurella soli TaxID=644556 RepID=A0ABP8JPB5_9ACTN
MKPKPRIAIAATSTAIALSVALTGCSNDTSGMSTSSAAAPSGGADAKTLLQDAAQASDDVATVHFAMATSGKVPNLPVTAVDGDLQNKPTVAAQGTATVSLGAATVDAKFVFIDGHMYADLTGGRYIDYGKGDSIYDVSALFDPSTGIPHILSTMNDPTDAGTDTVGGAQVEKITGTVSAADVSTISGAHVSKDKGTTPVPTTVWIQPAGDHELAQIQITPTAGATLTLTFSQWGETVTVTKPVITTIAPKPGGGHGSTLGN